MPRIARLRRAPRLAVQAVAALAAGLALAAPAVARAQAVRNLAEFRSATLQANDDGSTGLDGAGPPGGRADFGFTVNYFGTTYGGAYVNNNGNVTFDAPLRTFTPFGLTGDIGTSIIAPFFADVDTRGPGRVGSDDAGGNAGNVAAAFAGSGLVTWGRGTVGGRSAFGVNWFSDCAAWTGAGAGPGCAPYAASGGLVGVGYFGGAVDRLNIFQLVLIDRTDTGAGNFDIEFNYNQVQWETGDASGGTGGLGGSSARVGFSNGTGGVNTFAELAGSGDNGAFLDAGPAATRLTTNRRNSDVNGRYVFEVRSGTPDLVVPEPSTVLLVGAGAAALGAAGWRRRREG